VESFSYFGTNETDGLMGDLKVRTNALGQAVGYTWSTAGLMSSRTDERGNMMSLSYDWRGQMVAQTNADLTAIGVQYDPFGNRTNVIDELGHGTAYTYDGFNRVATMRDALGRTTTNEYGLTPGCGSCGGSGETVTRITRPDGKVTEFAYDHSGKRTNEVVAAGTTQAATTVWTYDAVGRLKTQVDAVGNLHTWVYDPVVAWSRRRTRSASRRSTHTTRSAT
jgi:YD repeat-containing protein